MRKIMLSEAVNHLQNAIKRKRDGLNEQEIDDEILAYISLYKYGRSDIKEEMKKKLALIIVNSGMVKSIRNLEINDWSDEE